MDKVYRIYTEDVHRKAVIQLVAKQFENFTLHETIGYYKGQPERSIVFEIIDADETTIRSLAVKIRELIGQKSVLLMSLSGQTTRV
jgi:hypothetical protein